MRCRISFARAILAVSILGLAAAPLGTAVDVAGAALPPVSVPATPSLPKVPTPPSLPPVVPTPPQAPVEVPTPPQVPAVKVPTPPQVPAVKGPTPAVPQIPAVKAPTPSVPGTKPGPSHPVPTLSNSPAGVGAPGVDSSSVGETANLTKGSSGGSAEAAYQTSASPLSGGEGSGSHGTRRTGTDAASIDPVRAAPLRVFFAYVWPAIALGPVGKLVGALQAQWERVTSLSVADVSRLLVGLTGAAGGWNVAGLSERSASSDPSPGNPSPGDARTLPVPSGGEISLLVFIIVCAALAALLVFTLRREFRSMHRWPL